jgi:hypothetical protein
MFELDVTKIPSKLELVYNKVNDNGNVFYMSVPNECGYVNYFVSTYNKTGHCGSTFIVEINDGSIDTIVGPWSSNATCINQIFPDVIVVDVVYNTPNGKFSGAMTLQHAQKYAFFKLIDNIWRAESYRNV